MFCIRKRQVRPAWPYAKLYGRLANVLRVLQDPPQHLPYTVTLCTRDRNYYTIEPFGLVLGPVPLLYVARIRSFNAL